MSIHASASLRITCVAAVAALLVGCGGSPSPSPSPSPVPSPTGAAFTLEVVPDMSVGRTIGGQRVVFLVTVSGDAGDAPVDLSAETPGATIVVEPERLAPGDVAEITVVPAAVAAEGELEVTITASRAGVERHETRTLVTAPGEDTLGAEAEAMLARFIPWLAANRPQLGITEATQWQGTPGSWVLVVNH